MTEMDPIEVGKLMAKVASLEEDVKDLKADMKSLLELAHQSKGGFWVGMTLAGMLGAVVTWMTTHFPFVARG